MLSAEDANQMRYKKGIVIKSGTDVAVIKENDLIYFDKRAGYTLIIKDEPMTIIQEKDVVVVL
jgi:co-chaperonin GroES (HSP10)